MKLWLACLCVCASALAGQGVITGTLYDAAGGSEYLDDAALVGVIALPVDSPPFNEITAAQWQGAFSAMFDPAQPSSPLGGLLLDVSPTGSFSAEVNGDGTFRVENLPFQSRLALAVQVSQLWWPLREEIWLTETGRESTVRVPYFRMGADEGGIRIARYRLNASGSLSDDLKYAPITLLETLEFINPDTERACMVRVELDLLVAPGLTSRTLPSQYGSQFMYMQGWNAGSPVELPFDDEANVAWTFGTGGGMHGQPATYAARAHASADNWHRMNSDPMLAMVGAGDTEYRPNMSQGPRSATLVFNRPVPPSRNGIPGMLVIHVIHKGGVLTASPNTRLVLHRSFPCSLLEADAMVWPELAFAALVEGAHRGLYGDPIEGETRRYPPNGEQDPDLSANERVQLILAFGPEAQKAMAAMEEAFVPDVRPEDTEDDKQKAQFNVSVLFKALALLFGLAFIGALVATVRKPREKQLDALAQLPASRREVLEAVNALEAEYKEGKLPARAYGEQRQRLLNRLVDFDSREGKP